MSDRKPTDLTFLLTTVFVVTFILVRHYIVAVPSPNPVIAKIIDVRPVHIAALAQNRKGYGIASFDSNTGRLNVKRYDVVYKDYDNCLMALFEQRAVLSTKASHTRNLDIKCEKTSS